MIKFPTLRKTPSAKPGRLFTLDVRLVNGPMEEAFCKANPEIIRTIQIRGDQTLEDLHEAIFTAFNREEEHMYQFEIGGEDSKSPPSRRFERLDPTEDAPEEEEGIEDATEARLDALDLKADQVIGYWFDFGDDWMHDVHVTAIEDTVPRGKYPKVVKRVGASPPQYPDFQDDDVPDFAEEDDPVPGPDDTGGAHLPRILIEKRSPLSAKPLAALGDRRAMERHSAAIHQFYEREESKTAEETQAAINAMLARGDAPVWTPQTPLERAQERMYDAFAAKGKKRAKLAREALALCPDCADAYVLLAEEESKTHAEALALYEQGMRAGERALGPDFFKENEGEFWGLLEARPYMRARAGVAECLRALDRTGEAVTHCREMLRLNPNDNQGMRDLLINLLLEEGDDAGARRLLRQYEGDWSATWVWSKFLLTFRTQWPDKKVETAFHKAMERNRFVSLLVTGLDRPPKRLPTMYQPGSEDEAVIYVAASVKAWLKNPAALDWIVEQLRRMAENDLPHGSPKRGM